GLAVSQKNRKVRSWSSRRKGSSTGLDVRGTEFCGVRSRARAPRTAMKIMTSTAAVATSAANRVECWNGEETRLPGAVADFITQPRFCAPRLPRRVAPQLRESYSFEEHLYRRRQGESPGSRGFLRPQTEPGVRRPDCGGRGVWLRGEACVRLPVVEAQDRGQRFSSW